MTEISNHIIGRSIFGRPKFSEEAKRAMRILESLMESGDVTIKPDPYRPGALRFVAFSQYEERVTAASVESLAPIQGEAMRFMLDPLEQAIESTAQVMRDEYEHLSQISTTLSGSVPTTSLYKRMGDHLDALLAAQLARVSRHE